MTTEEPEGYGALGVLSKEEAELEKVYDAIIKVGTLDGIRILSEQLRQERNKAIELIGAAQALCDWCESVGDKPDEYYLVKEALKTLTAHEL